MKTIAAIILLSLCGLGSALAQIDENAHWYNGSIVFTAKNQAEGKVLMNAMDEGEEHEFVLVPKVGEKDAYEVVDGPHDYLNIYQDIKTVRHQSEGGLECLCFYDANNRLIAVMSNEMEWEAEILNKSRWLNQMLGDYDGVIDEESERLEWREGVINTEFIEIVYEIETFNGQVTGCINASGRLEGIWQVVPTLKGVQLHEMTYVDNESILPFNRKRTSSSLLLTKVSTRQGGRFDYANTTLLNDKLFRWLKKSTLRIMRNSILARHGYVFSSPDLQQYFAGEPWYKPRSSNDGIDEELSLVERLNILLIKAEEENPLHDDFVAEK